MVLSLLLARHILALAVPPPNEVLTQPKLLNYTTNPFAWDSDGPFCHNTQSWRGSLEFDWRMQISCDNAAKQFRAQEVEQHGNTMYEFLDQYTKPAHDNPLMRTPRRYVYREFWKAQVSFPDNDLVGAAEGCTMALVLINDVPAKYNIERPKSLAAATDVESYNYIWQRLADLRRTCLTEGKSLGWTIAGKSSVGCSGAVVILTDPGTLGTGASDALAVLVFATNSPIDQDIPYGIHPLMIGNATVNGTVSVAER